MISNAYIQSMTLLAFALLSSCASISERRRHQYVYVQSNPPGAMILDQNKNLGTTPSLIYLRRQKNYEIELQAAGQKKSILLDTKYSWNGSFWGNQPFLGFAPYGWVTDLITGAAWEFQDPNPVEFAKKEKPKSLRRRIVIVPPLAENIKLSGEIAQLWEKKLYELYPKDELIPFKQSLTVLKENGFDFDERTEDEQSLRRALFHLQANLVFIPDYQFNTDEPLTGELKDVAGLSIEKMTVVPAGRIVISSNKSKIVYTNTNWSQFIPNTLGLEFSSTQITLSDETNSYPGVETGGTSTLGQAFAYLQAITLSRLQLPRFDGQSRWRFQFTPGARLSYKTIFFPTYDKLAGVEFNYFQLGAGIGPELGYRAGQHYTYLKLTPLLNYYQINWSQPGAGNEHVELGRINYQSELGYVYVFNNNVHLRLFVKSIGLDTDMWNKVASKVNPTISTLKYSFDSYSGLALGYTFDAR